MNQPFALTKTPDVTIVTLGPHNTMMAEQNMQKGLSRKSLQVIAMTFKLHLGQPLPFTQPQMRFRLRIGIAGWF